MHACKNNDIKHVHFHVMCAKCDIEKWVGQYFICCLDNYVLGCEHLFAELNTGPSEKKEDSNSR